MSQSFKESEIREHTETFGKSEMSFKEFSDGIARMGEERRAQQEEMLKQLKEQTDKLDVSKAPKEYLLKLFEQTVWRTGCLDPREKELYEQALEKMRTEILRRMLTSAAC